ncbi:YcnI family copper-binding membrane protein [Streptomyces sp. NPDC002004]
MKVSRVATVGAVAASAVLALSVPAFAHVTVQPEGEAAKGGFATIDFKVPNEQDKATTTKVEVNFPADHPLAFVQAQAIPGWTVELTKTKLAKPLKVEGETVSEAVSKVTWTADGKGDAGKGIAPGFFQKFPLSVGQLPEDTDQLVFKAVQTYDNKDVVRWIEPQQKGQPEPENPAPVLELSAASEDGHGAAAGDAADEKGTDKKAASSDGGSDTTARALGIAGIVVGVLGLGFGVLAGRRRTNG